MTLTKHWPARYGSGLTAVAVATLLRWWLERHVGPMPLFITWYPAVLVVASVCGIGPGILTTILSALVADYWFIAPTSGFGIAHANDVVAVGIFFCTGTAVSVLAERLHRARWAEAVRITQEQELALLNMGSLMTLDMDHRITRWSEGNRKLYGFSSEDAVGRLSHELLHTIFGPPLKEIDRELLQKGCWEGTVTQHTKDGTQLSIAIQWALRRDSQGSPLAILEVDTDLTERTRTERERELTVTLLRIVTASQDIRALAQSVVPFFRELSGCEAVGLRLRDGEDFPYYETRGFPSEFVQKENRLCACDESGHPVRDSAGNPVMECMCGNIICGRFNPTLPFFSAQGSFWTNSTTALLASTTTEERQARTRNRCNGEGYESVALLPLRVGEETLGLVQLNDRSTGMFSAEAIALWERLSDHLAIGMAKLRAELTVRKNQQKLSAIHDHSPFAIELIRFPEGVISEVNPAWERFFACSREAAVGKTSLELGLADDTESHSRMYDEIRTRGSIRDREMRYRTLTGKERMGSFSFDLVEIDGQRFLLGTAIDITARKEAEDELRRRMDDLARFNRVAVDRERRMIQLKLEVNRLSDQLGHPPPYSRVYLNGQPERAADAGAKEAST